MRTGKSPTSCLAHGRCRFHFIMEFDGKTLTPKNVTPSVVMFTDGPARMADVFSTAFFVASWDKGGSKSSEGLHPMLF